MDSFEKKSNMKSERTELYSTKMKEISFMAEYIRDIPEIFDTKTMKCKMFLMKIFTVLYPNFHYLSFLSEDDIDQELVKIASILQIYSHDPHQKNTELLQNINETNAHIFWIRFFNLCKIHSRYNDTNSAYKEICNNKILGNRFSSMTKILQHMNYNITILNTTNEADINQEISTWIKEAPPATAKTESSLTNISPFEVKENNSPEINNLISIINYIKKRIDHTTQIFPKKNCYFYKDFFVDFNQTVKQMSLFKKNLNFISSLIVQNIINIKTYNGINWLLYKYQMKRCNDIIENIILKAKNCNSNSLNINF